MGFRTEQSRPFRRCGGGHGGEPWPAEAVKFTPPVLSHGGLVPVFKIVLLRFRVRTSGLVEDAGHELHKVEDQKSDHECVCHAHESVQ